MIQAHERNRRILRYYANRKIQANAYVRMKVGMSIIGAEEFVVVWKFL